MRFISKLLTPDERFVMVSRLHWVYVAMGVSWFLFFAGIGQAIDYALWYYLGSTLRGFEYNFLWFSFSAQNSPLKWFFVFGGSVLFTQYAIKFIATEIALSSKRVIYKSGLIFVEIEEIDLEEIKGEHVDHGFFGWFLGYGSIRLDCRFIGDIKLPAVSDPYKLIKAIHAASSRQADSLAFAYPMPHPMYDIPQQKHHYQPRLIKGGSYPPVPEEDNLIEVFDVSSKEGRPKPRLFTKIHRKSK